MGRILIGGFAILSAMTLATSPSLAQDQAITVTGQAREYGLVRLPHRWLEPGE